MSINDPEDGADSKALRDAGLSDPVNHHKQNNEGKEIIKTQDPKYVIIAGKICNAETNKPIPDDEPIMIFRAKDMLAEQTISCYLSLCPTSEHKDAIQHRIRDFRQFSKDHPDRMDMPDTQYPFK